MVPYLRAANVKDGEFELTDVKSMNFTPEEQSIFQLQPGDVLVTEGSGSLASVGASAVWDGSIPGPICFQNTLIRLRPRAGISDRFLGWWARHAFGSGQFASIASGANIYHLGAEAVRTLSTPTPDPAEQRRIADFLDAETSRIDALIAAKQRIVAGLRARHDGLVLDRIFGSPGTWGRLARLVELLPGYAFKSDDFMPSGQFRLLRGVNVGVGCIRWDDKVGLDDVEPALLDRFSLQEGDIVIGMDRPLVGAGMRVAEICDQDLPALLVQRVARLRTAAVDRAYVRHALGSEAFIRYFDPITTGVSVPHISPSQILDFRVPIPRPSERALIGEQLDESLSRASALIATLTRQIALLRERRQALITAAVTGELSLA